MNDASSYGQVSQITEDHDGLVAEHAIFADEFADAYLVEREIFPETLTIRDSEVIRDGVVVPLD